MYFTYAIYYSSKKRTKGARVLFRDINKELYVPIIQYLQRPVQEITGTCSKFLKKTCYALQAIKEYGQSKEIRKMIRLKKVLAVTLGAALMVGSLAGCGNNSSKSADGGFDAAQDISVVSREEGSGTRGAFVELTGVEEKDADGNKVDNTTTNAITCNSTEVVLTTVAGDDYAIGYISLGALNDTVKALKIGGVEASEENINNGSYTLSRPFNIVTKDGISDVAQDFINYIMSEDGQKIISANKYIEVANSGAFTSTNPKGKIVVAGSSSVTPVMEKLIEAYKAINTNADIELQESDSTTGITSTSDGTCDIGMASRELKDTETALGLKATVIAMDGIAVIVNNNNPAEDYTVDQVKDIFTGSAAKWEDVK